MGLLTKKVKMPWEPEYEKFGIPEISECPHETIYERLRSTAIKYPEYPAVDFMGKKFTFSKLIDLVDKCAYSLEQEGVKPGDNITICLPNIPQCIVAFYATNKLGARACMVHPLSSALEVEAMLKETKSKVLFSLDLTYPNLHPLVKNTDVKIVVLSKINDYLPAVKSAGFVLKNAKKRKAAVKEVGAIGWNELIKDGRSDALYLRRIQPDDAAVILYSGGTSSGNPKGILLSSMNFNSLANNVVNFVPEVLAGDSILAILPLFHGFGLGICVHSIMTHGMKVILIPQFSGKVFINTIKKSKPNFVAGVPSMYEALVSRKEANGIKYAKFLKGAFCGGDTVPVELKKRFNEFMTAHDCDVRLREGYGLTETVTAATIAPNENEARGTVGFPFRGMYAKVVEPETKKEVPYGTDGEICLAGDQVMLGYMNCDDENAVALQKHADGLTWLHTGDMGYMDEKGYIFFKQRIKRIIKSSAFPVYPSLVEDAVLTYEGVAQTAVIGVKDARKGEIVKAFVIMKDKAKATDETSNAIITHCEKMLNKWSVPKIIEFRDELPLTKVGKVNIVALEKEELEKSR